MILARIVAEYGSAAVAGYTIAIRVIIFTIMPAWGMSNAAATLVGQNLGAGKPDRAERSVWICIRYNVTFMVLVACVFLAAAPAILSVFSDDAEVVRHGVDCLRILSLGYAFYGLGMVAMQALNGAGDTDTPTVINFFAFWTFQIPLAWWLAETMGLGPRGVFIAVPAAETLLALGALWAFRNGRWKRRMV
jgi:Na+-driven multidrug efflux pump